MALLTWSASFGRPGMSRYVGWQNTLQTPDELRAARFVEIPSLMQTGLFRRSAVLAATAVSTLRLRTSLSYFSTLTFALQVANMRFGWLVALID